MSGDEKYAFSVLGVSTTQIVDKLEDVILADAEVRDINVSDLTQDIWNAVAEEIIRRYFVDTPDDDYTGLIPARLWVSARPFQLGIELGEFGRMLRPRLQKAMTLYFGDVRNEAGEHIFEETTRVLRERLRTKRKG